MGAPAAISTQDWEKPTWCFPPRIPPFFTSRLEALFGRGSAAPAAAWSALETFAGTALPTWAVAGGGRGGQRRREGGAGAGVGISIINGEPTDSRLGVARAASA